MFLQLHLHNPDMRRPKLSTTLSTHSSAGSTKKPNFLPHPRSADSLIAVKAQIAQGITFTGFSIFPQPVASWTLAVVTANGVAAALLAAPVLLGALVDICQEKAQQPWRVGTDHSTWRSEGSHVWLKKWENFWDKQLRTLKQPQEQRSQLRCWASPPNQAVPGEV